jgi:hypothetical protein
MNVRRFEDRSSIRVVIRLTLRAGEKFLLRPQVKHLRLAKHAFDFIARKSIFKITNKN